MGHRGTIVSMLEGLARAAWGTTRWRQVSGVSPVHRRDAQVNPPELSNPLMLPPTKHSKRAG